MLIDGGIGNDWTQAGKGAAEAEAKGYDGVWAAETSHDPFLQLVTAAQSTERISIGTNIAVAFSRNPMTMAVQANDLQWLSKGRMVLGLGSQIKPHIEKRFSMPWSSPAARMREFVLAMRHIWSCWNEGTKLEFRGDFYTHTLMNPFFNPGPNPYGPPKVFLAGVGELMTEAAGEVCDGFLAHGFTTERYLKEVTIPALQRGMAKSKAFRLPYPPLSSPVGMRQNWLQRRPVRKHRSLFMGRRRRIAMCLSFTDGVPCRMNSTPCPSKANG
jgi:probable F420-dependent oxidoreductase